MYCNLLRCIATYCCVLRQGDVLAQALLASSPVIRMLRAGVCVCACACLRLSGVCVGCVFVCVGGVAYELTTSRNPTIPNTKRTKRCNVGKKGKGRKGRRKEKGERKGTGEGVPPALYSSLEPISRERSTERTHRSTHTRTERNKERRKEGRKGKERKGGGPAPSRSRGGAVRSLRPALTSSALRFGHVIVGIGIGIGVGVVAVVCIEVASSV